MATNPVTVLPNTVFTIIFIFTLTVIATTKPLPFVVFHGIVDECKSAKVTNFTDSLKEWSGAEGFCVEIGNGYMDTIFKPLTQQTAIACEKVKSMSELSNGYNIVAISQGNMVARGVIEFCDGAPPVKNYISVGGPQAGVAAAPCLVNNTLGDFACSVTNDALKLGVYTEFVQNISAPAGFIKIPTEIDWYLKGCKFLPKLNNEINGSRNSTYRERFTSLDNLVLIMHEQDSVLVPKETSWFWYYPDGSKDTVLPANQTSLYTEDWIGLKTLDDAGKVTYLSVPGEHANMSFSDMQTYIVPYINGSISLSMVESSFMSLSSI
ncbi:uncharacterized protein LOC132276449 [Cornus florida]|uniref:uncharacterized protein LOC132276449 n=1 Tax=Cornus florida TaxID=4283 RepID=UPI00289A9A6E|nr:uncharacterized protein LOC132276449 [Cornus florida]